MGKGAIEVISWIIMAALLVLVVMNASNVAKVVSSVGGFASTETSMFTGAGYANASGKAYG